MAKLQLTDKQIVDIILTIRSAEKWGEFASNTLVLARCQRMRDMLDSLVADDELGTHDPTQP